ncbi:hypothetical protein J6590_002233 [Homalodisca vitripennis]|nr:hypothetical protein J6590_002233 [Homalodisca vitripennis]
MSDKCLKWKLDFVISRGVKCTECGELYHLQYLTAEQGKKASRKNWKCEVCASEMSSTSSRAGEGGQSTVLQAIAAFRAESWEKLTQLQSDLKKVTTEIGNLNSKLHVVENRFDEACGDIVALKGENQALKEEMNTCRCHNVEFLRSDISVAHRLQGRSDTRPPSIVVSFVSRSTKTMWISAARMRKGLLASDIHFSFPSDSKIQQFNGARELVRQRLLSLALTNDGRVLAKSTPGGATFRIQHKDQLDQMKRRIMEFATRVDGGCKVLYFSRTRTKALALPNFLFRNPVLDFPLSSLFFSFDVVLPPAHDHASAKSLHHNW